MLCGDGMSMLFKRIVIFLTSMMYCLCLFLSCYNFWLRSLDDDYITDEIVLPRIDLDGDISNMNDKKDERVIELSYSSDSINFKKFVKIKIQGSSSIKYEKKNYTIKLYEDEKCTDKFKVDMGWGKENKYVLKANWVDKTHSRNIVSARLTADIYKKYGVLSESVNNGEIDGYPVEVYNNGEFLGLYTFNIPKDAWLFGLDEKNANHLAFEAEYANYETRFRMNVSEYKAWVLEVGEENEENLKKLNRLIDFILNSSDQEFKNNFSDYFDYEATLNYYIIANVLHLRDNCTKNMMLISYDGEIWYPILYDLDTSFGVNAYGNSLYENDSDVNLEKNKLFARFSKLYSVEIAERYFELRQDILTQENLNKELDDFIKSIPLSVFYKEEERWGEIPGYGVSQIKDFINSRFDYLDVEMSKKYDIVPDCELDKTNNYCKIFG